MTRPVHLAPQGPCRTEAATGICSVCLFPAHPTPPQLALQPLAVGTSGCSSSRRLSANLQADFPDGVAPTLRSWPIKHGHRGKNFAVCILAFFFLNHFSAFIGIHSSHFPGYCQPGPPSIFKSYFPPVVDGDGIKTAGVTAYECPILFPLSQTVCWET